MDRIARSLCVLGMAVASAAMMFSAGAAEGPLLRLGIVSDSHCSFLHDPEDRNTWGHQSTKTLQNAFVKFREWGVDAVVHPGDLTSYGTLKELEATGAVWKRVFPDDLGADGRKVEKLFVRGNHDKMGKEDDLDKLIRKDPAKAWKDVFGVDWYAEKVMLRHVNGYVFVLVDWEATKKDLDDFFTARENDLPKAKPFFFVCHAPPFGTVDPPQDEFGDRCGGDNIQCARWLKKFPNCIALTGHSHYSLTLGDQMWQEDFLSIGCGSLKYTVAVASLGGSGRRNVSCGLSFRARPNAPVTRVVSTNTSARSSRRGTNSRCSSGASLRAATFSMTHASRGGRLFRSAWTNCLRERNLGSRSVRWIAGETAAARWLAATDASAAVKASPIRGIVGGRRHAV